MYSKTAIRKLQWKLFWETTAMRDHLSWQTTHFWQKDLHFHITEPVTRDHLSWQTTFFSVFQESERFYCNCTYLYLLPLKDYTFQAEGPTLQYNLPLETTLDYFRNHIFTVKAVSTVCSVQNVIMFFIRERKCQCCRIVNTVEHLHFNTGWQ